MCLKNCWEKHTYPELCIFGQFSRESEKVTSFKIRNLSPQHSKNRGLPSYKQGFFSNIGKLVCSPLSPHLKWLNFFHLIFPKAMQCEAKSKSESILALAICLAKLQASKMELYKKEVSGKLMLPIPPIKMFT